MKPSDWISIVAAAVSMLSLIANVAVSLYTSKRQIQSSDRQIEENRRLAKEEHQHQNRPIMVPKKVIWGNAVTYFSLETGKANESFYGSDGRIDWSWQHEIGITVHNEGNGPALNVHCVLYGPENVCTSQFVSWDNGPIEGRGLIDIILAHSSELRLFHNNSIDGKHPLDERSLDSPANPWSNRIACFTLTYHDLFGKKYASIFHYTLQHQWIHVATREIPGFDLKELNMQKQQGAKLDAPYRV